jgi:hypothetical protein
MMARREKTSVEFIYCGCGCGKTTSKYGGNGMIRRFRKGHQNIGKKYPEDHKLNISKSKKGKKLSDEHRLICIQNLPKKDLTNEKHPLWKGDNVSNKGLHKYVRRHFQPPEKCQLCNQNPAKELANITGIYNRELKNWAYFCHICHKHFDNVGVRAWITRKNNRVGH